MAIWAAMCCQSFTSFSRSIPLGKVAAKFCQVSKQAFRYHCSNSALGFPRAAGSGRADSISLAKESMSSLPFRVKAGGMVFSSGVSALPPQKSLRVTEGKALCLSTQNTSQRRFDPFKASRCFNRTCRGFISFVIAAESSRQIR